MKERGMSGKRHVLTKWEDLKTAMVLSYTEMDTLCPCTVEKKTGDSFLVKDSFGNLYNVDLVDVFEETQPRWTH